MKVNLTIANDSDVGVKDLKVFCKHAGPSGTLIDSNTRTIYEIVKPHTQRRFMGFDMGFIHSQASTSECEIKDLALVGDND
jgi:hypothetical protein